MTNESSENEPGTETVEKPAIRKSQEEFIDDNAGPSRDKSEYERQDDSPVRQSGSAGEPVSPA